jgi:hypothetical protein
MFYIWRGNKHGSFEGAIYPKVSFGCFIKKSVSIEYLAKRPGRVRLIL